MKAWLTRSLSVPLLLILVAACAHFTVSDAATSLGSVGTGDQTVALYLSTLSSGVLADGHLNEAIRDGLDRAIEENDSLKYDVYLLDDATDDSKESTVLGVAQNANTIAVLFAGASLGPIAESVQTAAAEIGLTTKFVVIDAASEYTERSNMFGVVLERDVAAYAAGFLSASISDSGVVGVVASYRTRPVKSSVAGFIAGVQSVCSSCRTLTEYVYDEADTSTGSEAGNAIDRLVSRGVDVVTSFAGLAGTAALKNKVLADDPEAPFVIDTDEDLYNTTTSGTFAKQKVLTSLLSPVPDIVAQLAISSFSATSFSHPDVELAPCYSTVCDVLSTTNQTLASLLSSVTTTVNHRRFSTGVVDGNVPAGISTASSNTLQLAGTAGMQLPNLLYSSAISGVVDHSSGSDGDAQVLVFGGIEVDSMTETTGDGTLVNKLWSYDVSLGAWSERSVSGVPTARAKHTASVAKSSDKEVMVVFGGQTSAATADNGVYVYSFDRTDSSDSWQSLSLSTRPTARYAHAATSKAYKDADAPSEIYVFGGSTAAEELLSDLWRFDVASPVSSSSWTEITLPVNSTNPWPEARRHHTFTRIGDLIYLVGGQTKNNDTGVVTFEDTAEVWTYSIQDDEWTKLAQEAPFMRHSHFAASVKNCTAATSCEDTLLIHGGIAPNGYPSTGVFVFNPSRSEWVQQTLEFTYTSCPGRFGHAVAVIEAASDDDELAQLFLVGGTSDPDTQPCLGVFEAVEFSEPEAEEIINPCYEQWSTSRIRESLHGWSFAITVCIIVLGVAGVVTFYNYRWNRWEKITFEKVPIKGVEFKRTLADRFRQFTLLIDTVQAVAIIITANYAFNYWGQGQEDTTGGSYKIWNTDYPDKSLHLIKSVFAWFILDFDAWGFWAFDKDDYNNMYWFTIFWCFSAAMFFMFLCLAVYYETEKSCLRFKVGRKVVKFITFVGPAFGNLAFIPIVYNFLGVFACQKEFRPIGSNDDFTPYVARDCLRTCYESNHVGFSMFAMFGLLAYIPWAVYTAPVWQMLHDEVTIKDQPSYLIFQVNWKLCMCIAHAFFEQYPMVHSTMMFVLTAVDLLVVIFKRPTTLPYFDLVTLCFKATVFWWATCLVAGLWIRNWAAIIIFIIGGGWVALELFILNLVKLGDIGGRFAEGSKDYNRHQRYLREKKRRDKIERRRRLIQLSYYHNAVYNAENPRDVPPLDPEVMAGNRFTYDDYKDLSLTSSDDEDFKVFDEEDFEIRNKETGRAIRLLGVQNKKGGAQSSAKVLGLRLAQAIPTQTAMSFQLRNDNTGTLLIMRSPEATLYSYLQLKINGYVAYYNAYEDDTAVEMAPVEKPQGTEVPYLSFVSGPGHDFLPRHVESKEEEDVEEYVPVNNDSLLTILQNSCKFYILRVCFLSPLLPMFLNAKLISMSSHTSFPPLLYFIQLAEDQTKSRTR